MLSLLNTALATSFRTFDSNTLLQYSTFTIAFMIGLFGDNIYKLVFE